MKSSERMTRLDRLFLLLECLFSLSLSILHPMHIPMYIPLTATHTQHNTAGSSDGVRRAAALQIGELQKDNPLGAQGLIKQVAHRLLHADSWNTRVAA